MQSTGLGRQSTSLLVWTALVIATLMIGAWLIGPRRDEVAPAATDMIKVVGAAAPTGPQAAPPAVGRGRPVTTTISPQAAVAEVRRAYPLLSDAAMACDGTECTLTATIPPLVRQQDLDRRQEMLLGGLAAALAVHGYTMRMPFRFDEIDDNRFVVRASVTGP
jgi:hypothetical protein